jgi:hypothetical protein
MDQSKPAIPPSEFRLRSAFGRASADIDTAPAALAKSAESVAVYFQNEDEVREGFLVALRAMGIADVDQHSRTEAPPVGAKP